MELRNQVCNLESAKKFKELGVKQESLWYWQYNGKDSPLKEYTLELDKKTYGISKKDCSAFTVAELGEMLPITLFEANCMSYLSINKRSKMWSVSYLYNKESAPDLNINHDRNMTLLGVSAPTEADAKAKMLICLLENKLIKEG